MGVQNPVEMGHEHDNYGATGAPGGADMNDTDTYKPYEKAYDEPMNAGNCVALNLDWGSAGVTGKAGACWQCFGLEPCCGEPCNPGQGIYCCLCFCCCGPCSLSKLFGHCLGHCLWCRSFCNDCSSQNSRSWNSN